MEDLININKASEMLSISKPTLYRMAESRKIPHFKIGGLIRFSQEQLEVWLRDKCLHGVRN